MRASIGDAGGVLCFTTRYLYLLQIFLSPGPGRPLGDHAPRHTLRAAGSQLQVSVQLTNLPMINKDNLCCVSPLPKCVTRSHFGATTRPASLIFHENLTFLFFPCPRQITCKKIKIYTGVHVCVRGWTRATLLSRPSSLWSPLSQSGRRPCSTFE